jgi:predicted transposase/invertase (TIGR01784 family)
MSHPFYTARNDVIFKWVFGDDRETGPLVDFLHAVLDLPAREFAEVRILNAALPREHPDDKLGILDVKVKTASGQLIDIEIQRCDQPRLRDRMIVEQIGDGDAYARIQRAISILITDFVLLPGNPGYHNRYTLYDPKTESEFTDILEIDTLELPKLASVEEKTALLEWMNFLAAQSEEELSMLTTQTQNPQIRKAVAKVVALNTDERVRLEAESREKLRRDIHAWQSAAEDRGLQRGLQEGRQEGRLAIVRKLLGRGFSVDEITDITDCSRETVESLLRQIRDSH